MTTPRLEVSRRGTIAVARFNHPPHGYMDQIMVDELDELTANMEADQELRVVIFTGGLPGVFIQHYDVGELETMGRTLRGRHLHFGEARMVPPRALDRIFGRLETMNKVVVAAINGNAMGGGYEFCLACDLRIAEKGPFSIGLPEINIGILPGGGGTQKLARLVGAARALELVLRGRTVPPEEALALGMVHEAVDSPVLDRAMELAQELAGKSPLAVGHIKRLIRQAAETPSEHGLALERTLFLDLLVSDAAQPLMQECAAGTRDIRTR